MPLQAQILIKGIVVDSARNRLSGVTVKEIGTEKYIQTDRYGSFEFKTIGSQGTLFFQHLGYVEQRREFTNTSTDWTIVMVPTPKTIDEVIVSTGYQQLPKERATGSFSTVSNERFNLQEGTDVLSRLPMIANSVVMDAGRSQGSPQLMVRGLSTINGPKDPLIVLDNFPYDGDLNNINPNIVENITILKDAAASSIWGARAANGVIVITTKKGTYNRSTTFDMHANLMIGSKPDLYYIRQMNSSDYIDLEQELYQRKFYTSKINSASKPILSPVVDLLDLVDKGQVNKEEAQARINSWRNIDARDQFNELVYKSSSKQQYYLSAAGGASQYSWLSAIGYDRNLESLGNTYQRVNIRHQNRYQLSSKLSLGTDLYYTQANTHSGRGGYTDLELLPYMQIADNQGNPLAIPKGYRQSFIETFGNGKLLDWRYYPLTDWEHKTRKGTTSDLLASANLAYTISNSLKATIDYQYERQASLGSTFSSLQSYEARDYVNRFTQLDNGAVKYVVPKGGILDKSNGTLIANNLRVLLNYNKKWNLSSLNAIAGGEVRDGHSTNYNDRFYGYNPHNLSFGNVDYTQGYATVITGAKSTIQNMQSLGDKTTRFVSQFANVAYNYGERYTLSASVRRDASNLFGLKTNDQWNPFWSVGFAWHLANEGFYKSEIIPYLNLRATYGFSGNVDPAMVAVSTIGFGVQLSQFTGNTYARYNNFYNPLLKWETSKMLNLAIDFRTKGNRLAGSIEYFRKKGDNLFGQAPLDLTTGILSSMQRNVARMHGQGVDIELTSRNIDNTDFKWSSTLNFSFYKDAIDEYLLTRTLSQLYVNAASPPISGIKGHPLYTVYAYKWGGLDPNTGEAQGYLHGELSKDYAAITGTGTSVDELEFFGSAIPTKYGNFSNAFSYRGFNLNVGITYKFGYWFRRESINYTNLLNNSRGHSDYALRWQKPGDELYTDVPVNLFTTNTNRDRFYEGASVLVERGDHVRLQFIRIGYNIPLLKKIKGMEAYINLQNLGVIWKANQKGIDPDFSLGRGRIISPATYSLGIKVKI